MEVSITESMLELLINKSKSLQLHTKAVVFITKQKYMCWMKNGQVTLILSDPFHTQGETLACGRHQRQPHFYSKFFILVNNRRIKDCKTVFFIFCPLGGARKKVISVRHSQFLKCAVKKKLGQVKIYTPKFGFMVVREPKYLGLCSVSTITVYKFHKQGTTHE